MKHKIHKAVVECPEEVEEMLYEWYQKMPEQAEISINEILYGKHINNDKMYHLAVKFLKNNDGSEGCHWSLDAVENKANIDFDRKPYTLYDYAYAMNMLYSDYGNIFNDTSYFLKMAKNYLEDTDYMGDASERAYIDAYERIEYFSEEEE